jgi:hypothetical protein
MRAASRYLTLARLLGFDAEMSWRRMWLYLPNLVLVLPSFSGGRLGNTVLASWWLSPLAKEATEVPALVGAIEALRA